MLVSQLILLRAEAWEKGAIAVATFDGYLENLKFWCCIFHNAIHFFSSIVIARAFRLVAISHFPLREEIPTVATLLRNDVLFSSLTIRIPALQ